MSELDFLRNNSSGPESTYAEYPHLIPIESLREDMVISVLSRYFDDDIISYRVDWRDAVYDRFKGTVTFEDGTVEHCLSPVIQQVSVKRG